MASTTHPTGKRQRIGCRHAKQLRLDVARAQERTRETDCHANPE